MTLHPKTLFLLDGLGALLSAFLLGVVLVRLETVFGMPRQVLYPLSFIAFVFAVYSFLNYLRFPVNWRARLKAIAIANLLYCCLTVGLMIYFRQALTLLGWLYFVLEIVVVTILATFELKLARVS